MQYVAETFREYFGALHRTTGLDRLLDKLNSITGMAINKAKSKLFAVGVAGKIKISQIL